VGAAAILLGAKVGQKLTLMQQARQRGVSGGGVSGGGGKGRQLAQQAAQLECWHWPI
jgi:hypothetical protein